MSSDKLFVCRLVLAASCLMLLGCLLTFPRWHTSADLPFPHNTVDKAMALIRKEVDDWREPRLKRWQLGKAPIELVYPEQRVQNELTYVVGQLKKKLNLPTLEIALDQGFTKEALEVIDKDKSKVKATDIIAARILRDDVLAELRRQLSLHTINNDEAGLLFPYVYNLAVSGKTKDLENLLESLKTLQYKTMPTEISEKVKTRSELYMPVILDVKADEVLGVITDSHKTISIPFAFRRSALPPSVRVELTRWMFGHNVFVRYMIVLLGVIVFTLMVVERKIVSHEPEPIAERSISPYLINQRVLQASIQLALRRNSGTILDVLPNDSSNILYYDSKINRNITVLMVLLVSLGFVLAFIYFTNPRYPTNDRELIAYIHAYTNM